MLPSIRHRLMIAVAVIVGALSWSLVTGVLRAPDGSTGLVLFGGGARSIGNLLFIVLAGLPALFLALLTSAAGNPLSGVFVGSASLCLLAGLGGPADGWLRRAELPGDVVWLIVETLVWAVGLAVVILGIAQQRQPLRGWVRWLQADTHLGGALRLGLPDAKAIGAGLLCAAAGSGLAFVAVRTTDGGQVIGSLMLVYGIGAFLAQMVLSPQNPVPILMSPLAAALVTYGYILASYNSADHFYGAWFDGSLPASALVLPIQYASAGVAGSAAGIGVAQSFDAARADAAAKSGAA